MGPFELQLQQFATKVGKRADDLVGKVVVELAKRLDMRSPVGDPKLWKNPPPKGYTGGAFRGNWQLGIGVIPQGETGRIDPGGSDTVSTIIASVPAHPSGLVFYLTNNRPYGPALENGHSTQAPTGLVGLTVMEGPQIAAEAVAALQ